MKTSAAFLFAAAIALAACGSDSNSADTTPNTVVETTVARTDTSLSLNYGDGVPGLTAEQINDDTMSIVGSYDINGDTLEDGVGGPPSAATLATYAIYTRLIPAEYRVGVIAFVAIDQVESNGTDGALQEVMGTDGNPTGERYLSLDVSGSSTELERTIVHETGHYIFLTPLSVPTAYAEAFNAEFPPGGLYLPENFVSEYAASVLDGQEDIAESWAMFVLADTDYAGDADDDGNLDVVTPDTLAADKVAFFEDYPELVQLKAEILAAV